MAVDRTNWSGEGTFTAACLEALDAVDALEVVRVEDAPASRADGGFNFISNEIYVRASAAVRRDPIRLFGLPVWRLRRPEPSWTPAALAGRLAAVPGIGEADYVDEALIQYLRTERIVPPCQTRGIKVVELVRIYLLAD